MEPFETIFLEARAIGDAAQRAEFLSKACGQDAALLAKVKGMLRDAKEADEFFGNERTGKFADKPLEGPGTVIGRYKLLQKIGEGGMGVVYMAEQREPVMRKVALKIIKLGMDTPQVVARFETERQALALMDHSNIAKVLDGGATETGRPYFVMEIVQGLPITQFCDEYNLPTSERIKLFLDVCSAVQHAHQKGIIHRDLKPSNILVTMHGDKAVPKVIDFGVAKATQGRLTDKTVFTQFQQFVGTPAYMSPEQTSLSGLDVDTRSDIYALGVLLYELLTGKTPFDPKELVQAGLDQMRQIIREQEPPKPSTRLSTMQGEDLTTTARHRQTEAPKLIHIVRGDLDWIVMKCLEKDRARRYETANGLAVDLQRHLNDEPVTARPPSAAYRIQKVVQRNKTAFAAAAIVSVTLLLALVVSTWQAIRATRAAREAWRQTQIAQNVTSFLTDQLLVPVDPRLVQDYDPKKVAVVERAAQSVEGRFADDPLVEARVRQSLGAALASLYQHKKAAEHQEIALAIFRRLGTEPSNTIATATSLAATYYGLERRREADALIAEAIAAARKSPQFELQLAEALNTQGHWFAKDPRPEATNVLRQAWEILARTVGEDHVKVTYVIWDYTLALINLGNYEEAEKLLVDAINRSIRLHGAGSQMTGLLLKNQGKLFLEKLSRYNDAVQSFSQSWSNSLAAAGPDGYSTLESEHFLAQAYSKLGQTNRAAELFRDVSDRWIKLFPFYNARNQCLQIADWFARHGDSVKAVQLATLLRESIVAQPAGSERELEMLTVATSVTRGWPAAAELCRARFDDFPDSLATWRSKAAVFSYVGDVASYRKAAEKAIALAPYATNWESRVTIIQTASRGPFQFSAERAAQCDALIAAVDRDLPTATRRRKQQALRNVAALELRLGRPEAALKRLAESWEFGPFEIDRASTYFLESLCLRSLGEAEEARVALRKGQAQMEKWLPEPVSAYEGFLAEAERYAILLHREAQQVFTSK